jgi:hypothetical protein
MSLNIQNNLLISWSVKDDVYSYNSIISIPEADIESFIIRDKGKTTLDSAKLLEIQTEEYNTWLQVVKPQDTTTIEG